jgi:transcriptional regulator with XRE-family HTH domain
MAKKKRKEEPGVVEQLKEAIRESGLSLNQLSHTSGVSNPQLSRFMQGKRSLTLPAVEKICTALGLRLVGEKKHRPAKPTKAEEE